MTRKGKGSDLDRAGREGNTRGKSRRGGAPQGVFTLDGDGLVALMALVLAAATEGSAVRVGLTRDGGALAIGMYCGSEYGTEYVRPTEDAADAMREIAAAWLSVGADAFPRIEIALREGRVPTLDADAYKVPAAQPSKRAAAQQRAATPSPQQQSLPPDELDIVPNCRRNNDALQSQ